MNAEALAPVLRIGNPSAAIAWYQRLGFDVDFEHSSEPSGGKEIRNTAVVKRGDLILVLSNREEDAPAAEAVVYLRVADLAPIASEFNVPVQNLQAGALIGHQIELHDPDGNRIRVASFAPAPNPWTSS